MRRAGPQVDRAAASLDSLDIDGDRISARLRIGRVEHELAYTVPGVPLQPRYEPFLVAAVPIAMRAASSLSVPAPVSPRLLDSLPQAQDVLSAFSERLPLSPVRIEAQRGTGEPGDARGTGEPGDARGTSSFFSGGVDSFYTVLTNAGRVDRLIYLHGYDVALESRALRARLSRSVNAAAEALGLPLIEVETNVRKTSDSYLSTWFFHGAFLASVAHLLGPIHDRVLIPSTHSYNSLTAPIGSHPILDPLWSTERVEIVNDGIVSRPDKLAEVSTSEVAMSHLRVCFEQDTDYNCGRCQKCARTAALLHPIGRLDRCHTLPNEVPVGALRRIRVRNENLRLGIKDALAVADRTGTDPRIARVLRRVYVRGTLYMGLKPVFAGIAPRLWGAGGELERRYRSRVRNRRLAAAARE